MNSVSIGFTQVFITIAKIVCKVKKQLQKDLCMDLHEIYLYALLTKREVKMAGYWPSSLVAFLWTEKNSRYIRNVGRELS